MILKTRLSTITAAIATISLVATLGFIGGGAGQQRIALAQEEPVCTPGEWISDSLRCIQLLNTDETTAIRELDELSEQLDDLSEELLVPDVPDCGPGRFNFPIFIGPPEWWRCSGDLDLVPGPG
jgi:hypothetical protein